MMFLAQQVERSVSAAPMLELLLSPLAILVWLPIAGGVALAVWPNLTDAIVKRAALAISTVAFVVSLMLAWKFPWLTDGGSFRFAAESSWVAGLGVKASFAVDSISLSLILLTTFLYPLTILGAFADVKHRAREFFMWLLVLEGALCGVFAARDLILFFVFFEATLVPLYFLIGLFGGPQRRWAAAKFFIFTLGGSVFTFAGVLYAAWWNAGQTGTWSFAIADITRSAALMSAGQQAGVLAAFMIGLAVKVPLFPVHTWLPLAHTEAPTSGSVILAGVLLKLGTYGMVRLAVPFAPAAAIEYAPAIAVLSIIGILYAALICWVQTDIKRLVAYSSVSHLGFCVLGLFALNAAGIGGSVMYMINHGLSTGALFLCVGMIYERFHTRDMDELSGLGRRMPVWSFFMVFFCLASVGLPGLNGFVGEFLTLLGAFTATKVLGMWYAAVAAVGLILAAIYILYMVGKVVMGPVKEHGGHAEHVSDLNRREIAVLTPLAVACLVLGLYPTPLLRSYEPAIANITAETTRLIEATPTANNGDAALVIEQVAGVEGGAP